MEKLTHERNSGIKTGYWSPAKKEELVQHLAAYERMGLTPEQIREMDQLYLDKCQKVAELKKRLEWIPVIERLPEPGDTVLTYIKCNYAADNWRAYRVYEYTDHWIGMGNLCEVVSWMPLPEPYRPESVQGTGRI